MIFQSSQKQKTQTKNIKTMEWESPKMYISQKWQTQLVNVTL